jgi:hypothetical protein
MINSQCSSEGMLKEPSLAVTEVAFGWFWIVTLAVATGFFVAASST